MSYGQNTSPNNMPVVPLSSASNNVVGTTKTCLVSPVGAKYLVVQANVGGWNLLSGRDVALTVSSVNATTDELTVTGHPVRDKFGPYRISSSGTVPAGTNTTTNYFVKVVDANTLKLATSLENIDRGNYVDITSAGSGTITLKGERALPVAVQPGSSISNGSGCFFLPAGSIRMFNAPTEVTVLSYNASDVLQYYWI